MMHRVIDDFYDPADHLALDEAILVRDDTNDSARSDAALDILRVWEFSSPVVVAGRSTRVEDEINTKYCNSRGIPVLRRCSGGASVVCGPGCLMYSLVLSCRGREGFLKIDFAHQYVMNRVLQAVQHQVGHAELQGVCDLTWKDRKCSGNSLRVTRESLLYHGTLLYDFDLSLLAKCLRHAPRQPAYRQGRDHEAFVTNVPIDPKRFTKDLGQVFEVQGQMGVDSFRERIRRLREQRYDLEAWHFRH